MAIDVSELEQYRPAITGHCYRMLGSAADAEDAAQEAIVRAWRNAERFEGRASVKTWLHRIATNVCLDALSSAERRVRPIEDGPAGSVDGPFDTLERTHWLEPVAEARVLPKNADPHEAAVLRQSIRLAFVSALQNLPPRQRAALILADVVGLSATEIAESLEMTTAAVNSALQRARATLPQRATAGDAAALGDAERELLERYVDAFQRFDVEGLVSLLRDDAAFSMPPYRLWLQGPDAVRAWLNGPGCGCRGSRLLPVAASGAPAFAQYRAGEEPGTFRAWALIVLELREGRIAEWTGFLDTENLFPLFGLPLEIDERR